MRQKIIIFLLILSFLSIIYAPTYLVAYAHHDDILFWLRPPGTHALHGLHQYFVSIGRIGGALLLTGWGWFVNHLADMSVIHFLSVLQLSVAGWICLIFWERYLQNRLEAFLATVIMLTLPAFQVIISCSLACIFSSGLFFSALSAYWASQMPQDKTLSRRSISRYGLLSFFSLLIALNIYPSTATFYWVVTALILLSLRANRFQELKPQLVNLFCIGFLNLGLYAVLLRLLSHQFAPARAARSAMYNPYVMTTDVIEKLQWFVQEPLNNVMNLWNITPHVRLGGIIMTLILLFGILALVKDSLSYNGDGRRLKFFIKSVTAVGLFFILTVLSFLPNLIAVGNASFYRCLAGLSGMLVILMIWSGKKALTLIPHPLGTRLWMGILLIGCLFGMFQAYHTVFYYRVLPSYLELTYLQRIFRENDLGPFKRYHVIRPRETFPYHRYDELGVLTSQHFHNIIPITVCALREIGKENQLKTLSSSRHEGKIDFQLKGDKIMLLKEEGDFPLDQQTLLIDMNQLVQNSRYLKKSTP